MVRSKSIDIINKFDEKEFREFGKFVNSPYFNSNSKLCELYSVLIKNYPGFTKRDFTKEKIYEKLFPGKKFNDGTMRKLLSGLQSLAEEYLSHSALNNHYFAKQNLLLNKLDEKRLDVIFNQHLVEIFKTYEQEGIIDDQYFRNNFEIYETLLSFQASVGKNEIDVQEKCFFYLISHCIVLSLKLSQNLMAGTIEKKFDFKNTLLFKFTEQFDFDSFIKLIKNYSPQFYPVLRIYYLNFLILSAQDDNDNYFWEMKKLIGENIHKFSRFEKYNLMLFLENGASLKIRDGKIDFVKHIHEIHRTMLDKNIYESDDNQYFHIIRFWKIVSNALRLNEFEWTENFVKDYSNRLAPEYTEHMRNYSYAMLYFAKGQYDESLECASKTKPLMYNIRYDLMFLKIKCCYELGLVEELYYHLDSFKHLLKNDTSPEWAKKRFENFLLFFENLVKLKKNPGEMDKDIEFFNQKLQKAGEVSEKRWLLEKANLLD